MRFLVSALSVLQLLDPPKAPPDPFAFAMPTVDRAVTAERGDTLFLR